jgi:methionyl-tRNA synthetase
MEDVDLNLEDFMKKINSDLVGKYINILSRTSGFIIKIFQGKVVDCSNKKNMNLDISNLENKFSEYIMKIQSSYENRNTSKVIRDLITLMDLVNLFIDENKPWVLAKQIKEGAAERDTLHLILSITLNFFAKLTILIKPILPVIVLRIEEEVFETPKPWVWEDIDDLKITSINPVGHLISRVEQTDLEKIKKRD